MTIGRSILLIVLLVLICVAAPSSHARQTPAEGVIRINVNLVQVDAIVTDSKGKPVTDLTADDFEVLQDGKPQSITNFAFINVKDAKVTLRPPARKTQPVQSVALPPPPPPRPEEIRRTIAVVVDDLALSADSIVRVRQSLKKWVDEEMRPGDLVAVIRTSAGMGALQQFSVDRRMLYAAIDLIQFHLGRVGVESFAPLTGAPVTQNGASIEVDTTLFDSEVAQTYMLGSMGAIQYVLSGLRDLPGRKSLILFSENLKFTYIDGRDLVNVELTSRGVVEEKLRKLIDEANRSSVVVYAMDPRGVAYTGLTASDFSGAPLGGDSGGLTPQAISQTDTKRLDDLIASHDGMIILTQKTGGVFLANNDIQGSLRQLVDDGDGYYLLGYQPDSATFEGRIKQPKFHTISVRVKRPGLTVRSRSGFFGTPDGEAPAPVGRAAQMIKAMASPFAAGAVRVRLTTLFSHSAKEGSYINALFHFDTRDLQFTEQPGGAHSALIDTFAATFDVDGKPVDTADKIWALRVDDGSYEDVLKRGMVYSLRVPVKKPGAYQMRVVLRDSTSEKIGSATQFIEVPDIAKGRLALSGIVLSAERSRTADGGPLAEGASKTEDEPNWSPAIRVFKSGTAIIYAYQIMNARQGADKKVQLQVQTRLFREGQQVYSGSPITLAGEGAQDPKHLAGTGRIELTKAAPGHYALQVIVTDRLAKEKYRLAAQSVDFDVAESSDQAKK